MILCQNGSNLTIICIFKADSFQLKCIVVSEHACWQKKLNDHKLNRFQSFFFHHVLLVSFYFAVPRYFNQPIFFQMRLCKGSLSFLKLSEKLIIIRFAYPKLPLGERLESGFALGLIHFHVCGYSVINCLRGWKKNWTRFRGKWTEPLRLKTENVYFIRVETNGKYSLEGQTYSVVKYWFTKMVPTTPSGNYSRRQM